MPTFITPYSGSAQLTASSGLEVVEQARWQFNKFSYADGATFGVTLAFPTRDLQGPYYDVSANPPPPSALESGLLHLRARAWTIADIGNQLTSYTPPGGPTYPADRCRITVTGAWWVIRTQISASYNSFGVSYGGRTETDQGGRDMSGDLLTYQAQPVTYRIQGSAVEGGAQDTFSDHEFWCRITESTTTINSNRAFASNTSARPVWAYTYAKSWQTD